MSEFNFNDEIEGSNYADFTGFVPCRFLADIKNCSNYVAQHGECSITALTQAGQVVFFRYARPATPKILIDGIQYSCTVMQAVRIAAIKKELRSQYDIITGEV